MEENTVNPDCECAGTGLLLGGKPCPKCSKEILKKAVASYHNNVVPMQYQGVVFDKSFLPLDVQNVYGDYMEDLLNTIVSDYQLYQKNLLICSRPNSGKTVWAYNLIMLLTEKGYEIPTIMDLISVREHINYRKSDIELTEEILSSRGLIVRLPADMQFWMFDIMQSIIERRVAKNGFTIFLYSGNSSKLKEADRDNVLKYLLGTGAYHTIKMEDFTDVRTGT